MSLLGRIRARFSGHALKQRSGRANKSLDPEGWQVGDWAECIHMGQWYRMPDGTPSSGPRHGRIGRVTGVRVLRVDFLGEVLALGFDNWPGEYFDACGFRKVNPRADEATAAEAEFTALIRRKPAPALPRETIREHQ